MSEILFRILVVDDERPIRRFLHASLSNTYTVLEAETGSEALLVTVSKRPDVILLDLGLPDMDGIEVTKRLREWTQIPIIVLSVLEREETKVAALDAGADDYLTKPFGIGELMARLRVVFRRSIQPDQETIFQDDELVVNFPHREVSIQGKQVALTPTEYDILRILVQHAGKVLTHRQLIQSVWGTRMDMEDHLLRVNISNLRRKIELDSTRPKYILTEPGVGYRLKMY